MTVSNSKVKTTDLDMKPSSCLKFSQPTSPSYIYIKEKVILTLSPYDLDLYTGPSCVLNHKEEFRRGRGTKRKGGFI